MIRLSRPRRAPSVLSSARAARAKKQLAAIVHARRRPKSHEFDPLWGDKQVRSALWRMQHKKCCYCERLRDATRESDIEHYRPKCEVAGCGDAGYWWLAYTWTNLLFSCKYCNQQFKRNHFPLLDENLRARRPRDSIAREQPYLIDPSQEDPSQFIGFDWAGGDGPLVRPFSRAGARRGAKTIEILGLDRIDLNTERAELLSDFANIARAMHAGQHRGRESLIREAAAQIRRVTSSSREFAGFAREYFRAHGLGDYVASD